MQFSLNLALFIQHQFPYACLFCVRELVTKADCECSFYISFLFKDFIFLIPEIYMTLQPDATFEAASYLWFPKQIILIDANIKN